MGGDDRNWILVKVSADHADPERDSTHDDNRSVLTGLTNDELEAEP